MQFRSYQKYTSAILIFLLFLTQTIQVSFFDRTDAATEDYHDLVSIIVDADTYGSLKSEIKQYSTDIQSYLGSTRVSLFVVPKNTPPEAIAAQNEKLYYNGDGKKGISTLVGTILIGNVPIPVVKKEGSSFPSLYPYVDFEEKHFVYDFQVKQYIFSKNANESSDVEIWHGVINPALGREWNGKADITKIEAFLEKTHEFYTQKGKFTPSSIPPRVFYYDGYNESASASIRSIFQYGLFIQNVENFAYKRFTKYLLSDINTAIDTYDKKSPDTISGAMIPNFEELKKTNPEIATLGTDTLSSDALKTLSDIQTPKVINNFVKRFHEIVNSKTLGDEQLFVHNAGRYNNGSAVNIDQGPVQISLHDETAIQTIKGANTALENSINGVITDGNFAKRIPIFDSYQNYREYSFHSKDGHYFYDYNNNSTEQVNKVYKNYFLGQKSTDITDPKQCTIARGSSLDNEQMGKGVLVEANSTFDINTVSSQADLLSKDTSELVEKYHDAAYSCFDTNNNPKLGSYWKNNSFLKFSGDPNSSPTDILFGPLGSTSFVGMSLPVFSLGGMKESNRVSTPSLTNCTDNSYQYALLQPYIFSYSVHYHDDSDWICNSAWPGEWTANSSNCKTRTTETPRYTCLTEHVPLSKSISTNFTDRLGDYSGNDCFVGSLSLDQKIIRNINNVCKEDVKDYEELYFTKLAVHQNLSYHTIPSLLTHVSPTSEEITAAEVNQVTPNIPVDVIRSLDFLTPKGNIATFTYPNFFKAPGKTLPELRLYLKNLSESEWKRAIDAENAKTLSPSDLEANTLLGAGILPATPIDWNTLISDEVLIQVLQAKNWLHPDVSEKYQKLITSDLSYSQTLGGDPALDIPKMPGNRDGYEIAYLGLSSFRPSGTDEQGSGNEASEDYKKKLTTLQAVNLSEVDTISSSDSDISIDSCPKDLTNPSGVDLFKWPSAISCWLQSLQKIRPTGGSCGGNTVGLSEGVASRAVISDEILSNTSKLKQYFDSSQLVYTIPRTVMQRTDSLGIDFDFQKDGSHIDIPENTEVKLDIISLKNPTGENIPFTQAYTVIQIAPSSQPYSESKTSFTLLSKNILGSVLLRATLTTKLPDGTIYTTVSNNITLRISDEYIDVSPLVGGVKKNTIDTTLLEPVQLSLVSRNAKGNMLDGAFPYTLDIYDDVSGVRIASGITISTSTDYVLPVDYIKKIGVYRFSVRDNVGRFGEATLAVRSGPLAQSNFFPLSDTIVKERDSYGVIELLDAKNNLLPPELHTIILTTKGGYLIDKDGKHTDTITLNTLESQLPIAFGSDRSGDLEISYSIDGVVKNTRVISVIDTAKVRLSRRSVPQVGGQKIALYAEVLDSQDRLLSGFHSSLSFSLPESAGSFSTQTVAIENGKTEDIFFTPGRVSGNQTLSLYAPGIGNIPDIPFFINSGDPFYIDSSFTDTQITFTIFDRYGNRIIKNNSSGMPIALNFTGTLKRNSDVPIDVSFIGGVYSFPRQSGYFIARVPDIEKSSLTYTDIDGVHTVFGISVAPIFVPPVAQKFTFRPDYNARYTVFAGESFLREGESILYDTLPGMSQSLASTTLLTSPYQTEDLFSIFPSGSYNLGNSPDLLMKASVRLEKNTLLLEVTDDVTRTQVARVAYPTTGLVTSNCEEESLDTKTCVTSSNADVIRFISFRGSEYQIQNDGKIMTLSISGEPRVRYDRSTGLVLASGVGLVPVTDDSISGLVLDVKEGDKTIGRIFVSIDPKKSVQLASDIFIPTSSILLDSNHSSLRKSAFSQVFDEKISGFTLYKNQASPDLDENMIGPHSTDSLGAITDTPGVGWHDKNRTLLSYAAGDTVGESTQWFHTYTLVNLGDPVAHVEKNLPGTNREGIDRSIGKQIASSGRGNIVSTIHHDMNNDGFEDILVIYDDGFIQLYLNMGDRFRKRQMIGYIPDISPERLGFGDFTGDGYSDMIGINHSGSLLLLDNTERKFAQKTITLVDPTLAIPNNITQYQIYDMDSDKKEDIVYLTEGGELGVLYGTSTSGVFSRKIADSKLGVSLSEEPEKGGGVFRANTVPTILTKKVDTENDDSMIQDDVYYHSMTPASQNTETALPEYSLSDASSIISSSIPSFDQENPPSVDTDGSEGTLFVHSEYAPAFGLDIQKKYKNISSSNLRGGDIIEVDISLKNTTTSTISGVRYMDTIPNLFDATSTQKYQLALDGSVIEKPFLFLHSGDFDAEFMGRDIPSGKTLHIIYQVKALASSFGEMKVGNLQKGQVGEDIYGDIGFNASKQCGSSMLLWKSNSERVFIKSSIDFLSPTLSPEIQSQIEANNNQIKDLQNISSNTPALTNLANEYKKTPSGGVKTDASFVVRAGLNTNRNYVASLDASPELKTEVTNIAQTIADGLACGFGGGSCISFPMNWAPLAPGNDPVLFGRPIGDGLRVDEGIPVFSALTGLPNPLTGCFPVIWPISPMPFQPGTCGGLMKVNPSGVGSPFIPSLPSVPFAAGGYLGTSGKFNFLRIFVTPTLTLGMGTAICMGPADIAGKIPPKGLSPFIPGGNCIVMTKPMNVCKGDGSSSDGDVRGVSGLGSVTDSWNAGSCTVQAKTTNHTEDATFIQDMIDYLRNPDTKKINNLYTNLSKRGPRNLASGGPLLKMDVGNTSGTKIDIDLDTSKPFTMSNIIKVKNRRIPGFPEFIMDWVARQTDEFTNKLMNPPNIVIIPPRNFSQYGTTDKSFANFSDAFSSKAYADAYNNFEQKLGQAGTTNTAEKLTNMTRSNSSLSAGYEQALDAKIQKNASLINRVSGGVNQAKAAFQFLGQLPFLKVQTTRVTINVPWILPQELDRYARTFSQYQRELDATLKQWCVGKTPAECADIHANANIGALKSSIERNLQIIETYKRFPEKLQKYITWKQRYISQILCNVDIIEKTLVGWYRDNGIRFRKWAEFYVLVKSVMQSWQPVMEIFKKGDAQCSVCRNERGDLKAYKIKLISMLIPSLPIIQMPRWPDIVLDLSDIRLGMTISVPEFDFRINPIRLPNLPLINLPAMPSASLSLPALPILPAIPNLPSLPDLPSLPRIQFPNLPPPPKLPKIFGSIQASLGLLQLFQKIRCFMEKTVLIPEWQVGSVIADRTERQSTLNLDFLKIQIPQFAIPTLREIRISTHVNFEKRTDFITEFAKKAVKPINEFSTDMQSGIQDSLNNVGQSLQNGGKSLQNGIDDASKNLKNQTIDLKQNGDVNVNGEKKGNIQSSLSESPDMHELLADSRDISDRFESEKDILLDTDMFADHLRNEMKKAGQDVSVLDRSLEKSRLESTEITKNLEKEFRKNIQFFHEYLDAETAHTKEQEKMIDRLQNSENLLLSNLTDIPLAQFVSNESSIAQQSLETYQNNVFNTLKNVESISVGNDDFEGIKNHTQKKLTRLLAANTTSSSSSNTDGYTPIYQGIYVLTPSGYQTKLFDYTSLLSSSEKPQKVDLDKDGDADYMYILGGSLYVKFSSEKSRPKTIETDIDFHDLDQNSTPEAPNFFNEEIASPGRIQASFSPANSTDRQFRLEFFDRYTQWDIFTLNTQKPDKNIPKTMIDFFVEDPASVQNNDGIEASPVLQVLQSVDSPENMIFEGMNIISLKSGTQFTLTAGRGLYTGSIPATLKYTLPSGGEKTLQMKAYQKYVFSENISAIVTGKLYILSSNPGNRITYTDDLIGMPILPGVRIINPDGKIQLYNARLGSVSQIFPGEEYRSVSLGPPNKDYQAAFPYVNGMYSAKISTISKKNPEPITAGVTLMAPQLGLDGSAPVVDIPTKIRVPVYQAIEYDLKKIISDVSPTTVTIDPDTTIDSDNNGSYDDDFVSSGTGVKVSANTLTFGPFDELGNSLMQLKVQDAYGNINLLPLQLEVFAPVPQITTITPSGFLLGNIDPVGSLEPIHFFRIRSGSPLTQLFSQSVLTKNDGTYETGSIFVGSGVGVTFSGAIYRFSEASGLPISPNEIRLGVTPATSIRPLLFTFSDKDNIPLFEQTIVIPEKTTFLINPSSEITPTIPSLIVHSKDNSKVQLATPLDPSIPGGMYITSDSYVPLAGISRDGQIYSLLSDVTLSARKDGEFLLISINNSGKEIVTLKYMMNFFYTVHNQ